MLGSPGRLGQFITELLSSLSMFGVRITNPGLVMFEAWDAIPHIYSNITTR